MPRRTTSALGGRAGRVALAPLLAVPMVVATLSGAGIAGAATTVGLRAGGPAATSPTATPTPKTSDDGKSTKVNVEIPTRDGVTLYATVQRPAGPTGPTGPTGPAGPTAGRLPIVIMPGTFAGDTVNIDVIASKLAARGYLTVSYLERGFGKSGGSIDAGGPDDVNDVSDALDWTLAHTDGDRHRIGLASISYGAGFAPIVTVKDHRFKAAAMISGWGDMWESRYPNQTSAWASNTALWGLSNASGRPGADVQTFFRNAVSNTWTDEMRRFASVRSPKTYLPQLKRHAVPLYVSTSMNEMIWPADQTIAFFNAYPGTKHLDILPGDHATTELGTPVGIPGVTWQTAFAWMDAYVAGTDRTAARLPPVRVAPRGPNGTNVVDSRLWSTWPFEAHDTTAVRTTRREYLSTKASAFGLLMDTTLSRTPGSTGKKLRQGENLLLQNGIPMYEGGFEVALGRPTTTPLFTVDQGVSGLWTGPALSEKLQLRGATKIHLDLAPSARKGSAFVYLLDQDASGLTTYVIGHKPYSWTTATPGTPMPVDVTIPYNAYDVPAGHRLIVGVSTGDVMYTSNNPPGSSITVGPGSYVDLPLK